MSRYTAFSVPVLAAVLSVTAPALTLAQAEEVQPAPPPAAAVAAEAAGVTPEALAAKVEQYKAMGLPEDQAGMLAILELAEQDEDSSSLLPLLMLMGQEGGGGGPGDIMGLMFFMSMFRCGHSKIQCRKQCENVCLNQSYQQFK